jgi:hypothetical protein
MIRQENDPSGREFVRVEKTYDVVVVGAGPAGIAAALAAARAGAKTALISDRPVLGGSASSEVRVTPSGADAAPWNRFARETGIMEEMSLLLAAKTHRSGIWRWLYYDELYFDLVHAEPNLEFFLNTSVYEVACHGDGRIASATALQLRSEKIITFNGTFFIDCSGDGTVGFLAGADYRIGREGKSEYDETHAPDEPDGGTMGATLLFSSVDRGHPVPYTPPAWALDVADLPTLIDPDKGVGRNFYRQPDACAFYGLWWAEYGGDIDSIHDDDQVMWHCRQLVYGLWDYIKNSGKFKDVERQELDWIAYLPGKRESRRLLGPYIATAHDFLAQRSFPDAIGHCGWPIDIHPPHGYRDPEPACTHDQTPGIIDIPFRILFSRNVENLMFAGRNISVSHEGLGTLRVIATTAVMGQAVGEAAAYCVENDLLPQDLPGNHMPELQRRLVRNDQTLVGYRLQEEDDLSRSSRATASSVAALELGRTDQWQALTSRLGLIVPVVGETLDSVSFHLEAREPAEVVLNVYAADRPENYRFAQHLGTYYQVVHERAWQDFDLGVEVGPGQKLIFVFEKNPSVHVGLTCDRLTGALGIAPQDVPELGYRNSFRWLPHTPSFRLSPEQPVYGPEQAINGYIRPHGLPNCWASSGIDVGDPEWLELGFARPAEVASVELVFNSDLNVRRHDFKGSMYPELVRDYDVVALTEAGEETVVRVRENCQRFRRHSFAPLRAKGMRLVVYQTWGAPRAEVFDLRVYGPSPAR